MYPTVVGGTVKREGRRREPLPWTLPLFSTLQKSRSDVRVGVIRSGPIFGIRLVDVSSSDLDGSGLPGIQAGEFGHTLRPSLSGPDDGKTVTKCYFCFPRFPTSGRRHGIVPVPVLVRSE